MLHAATAFGLSRDEAWQVFKRALEGLPPDFYEDDCMDQIAGVLAHAILEKQRRVLRERKA
jgi:hypothetical protein